eukprot:3392494-Rhodomonas_salina.1
MYGGSFADGTSLRPFAIFNCSPETLWLLAALQSSAFCAATNVRYKCAYNWNVVGQRGTRSSSFFTLLTCSPEDPVVLIVDGHGSHFTVEVLEFCIEHGIHIVLRPPHTSHRSQG